MTELVLPPPTGRSDAPSLEACPEPLPLPAPGWGVAEAHTALAQALDGERLPPEVAAQLAAAGPPVTVSALSTVVLRLGDLAVKVYPPGTDPDHVAHLAGALAGSSTALLPLAPPVATTQGVVSTSRWLASERAVTWAETGRLLRLFHEEHAEAVLPRWQPLSRLESQVAGLPEEHAQVLVAARSTLLGALGEVRSELGEGTVHGDLSPLNVLCDGERPWLIDLDWSAVAPRELDLAPAAQRLASGEISSRTYRGFCRAYGHDVRRWAGLPVLERVAALGALVFAVWDCRHHGRDLDWLDTAVARWRTPL